MEEIVSEHSWNSEHEVIRLLLSLIETVNAKDILEIGTFKGAFPFTLMINEGLKYTGIDIEDHRSNELKELFNENEYQFILGNSINVLNGLPRTNYDLIYIDSVHEFDHCMAEFKACELLIKPGGLICFHDSIKFEGVTRVIDYIKLFDHFETLTLPTPHENGITIVKCNY